MNYSPTTKVSVPEKQSPKGSPSQQRPQHKAGEVRNLPQPPVPLVQPHLIVNVQEEKVKSVYQMYQERKAEIDFYRQEKQALED